VGLYTGPEGALYVVDLYRGILQHRVAVTSYLRAQITERGLEQPVHLGRIWRIVPTGKPVRRTRPNFAADGPTRWVDHLSSPNAWWRETAQRLLVEARNSSTIPRLREVATSGASPLGRMHALWTLEGLGQADSRSVAAGLAHTDARVRVAAIAVSERLLGGASRRDVVARLLAMSLSGDPAPQVQLQLALTLGEIREPASDAAIIKLATTFGGTNKYLLPAAISGLSGRELELLQGLLADRKAAWNENRATVAAALARCVFAERKLDRVERLLSLVASKSTSPAARVALLDGALTAASATRRPLRFPAAPPVLAALGKITPGDLQGRIAKLDASIVWPDKPGVPPEVVIAPLTPDQQRRFDHGKQLFTAACAACHQPTGLGREGLAPPLVESEWVLGSEQRLIRIVLHGLAGRIGVKGVTYNLDMPALGIFDDEQVADVLTYVRREWEHNAPPVFASTVKQIRALETRRVDSWRQRELLQLP
jgi:mono/diheme cytochrome c family protein